MAVAGGPVRQVHGSQGLRSLSRQACNACRAKKVCQSCCASIFPCRSFAVTPVSSTRPLSSLPFEPPTCLLVRQLLLTVFFFLLSSD